MFLHIPKTGGTSIENKLGLFERVTYGVQDHRTLAELQPPTLEDLRCVAHPRGLEALAKHVRGFLRDETRLSRRQYREYFKFSFVRNTWARVHSVYRNSIRDHLHRRELGIRDDCSFGDFLTLSPGSYLLHSQLYWLRDRRGEIAVDFVGRFERLAADFAEVCGRLGIEDPTLPHLLESQMCDYTAAYDDQLRALVARRYREEIDRFGFRFGDP